MNASVPGDVINVCSGTYTEQVDISPPHNSITLRSTERWAAVIQAPSVVVFPGAVVHVNGARDVSLLGFTITGNGRASCAPADVAVGVLVNFGASAVIAGNHVTGIGDATREPGGCQVGTGIQIGSYGLSQDVSTPGTGWVLHNLVDRYQKDGLVVNEPGSYGLLDSNRVKGVGPTVRIAQNGIQIGFYAHADVIKNSVSDNVYTDPIGTDLWDAAGILLYSLGDGHVRLRDNLSYKNDHGIYLAGDPNLSAPDGLGPTQHVRVERNQTPNNVINGLFADELTLENLIKDNRSLGNGQFDCRDDSAPVPPRSTSNYWVHDIGKTQNKPDLCTKDGDNRGDEGDHFKQAKTNQANLRADR